MSAPLLRHGPLAELDAAHHRLDRYYRRERHYGSFSRAMTLPPGVDASQIEAKTKDGVLELTIPLPAGQKKESTTIKPSAA